MPLIYNYYELALHFYTNDSDIVCINARNGNRECWAELDINEQNATGATIHVTPLRDCLNATDLDKFKKVLGAYPSEIHEKWQDFFVRHEYIETEHFTHRIKSVARIPIIDQTVREQNDNFLRPIISVKRVELRDSFLARFYFSDGKTTMVDFKPFLKSSAHPLIRGFLDREYDFANWLLDGTLDGFLGWPYNLLSFSTNDFYHGQL